MTHTERIVIRSASPADEQDIAVLGVIDGGYGMPEGHVVLAEVDGRIRAAVGSNGVSISDPFFPSAGLVSMLRVQTESESAPRAFRRLAQRPGMRLAAGV
jgi:hypothetical protein